MLVALASLNQRWEDKSANFVSCENLIQKAKAHRAELIIFPEMTLTGFSMNIKETAEEIDNSYTVKAFRELSKRFNIGVIFGVVFRQHEKATNNSIFMGNAGEFLANYKKIHPFSLSGENEYFEAGEEILFVDFGLLRIGLTICYDLRFPEIYSALGVKSELIVNIANWPAKRIDHWITLLKARAIENQIYVAGVNRIGIDNNGLEYMKSSMIFNPNGEIMIPVYSEEQLDIYDINSEMALKFRSEFSTTQDRKPNFYKSIL